MELKARCVARGINNKGCIKKAQFIMKLQEADETMVLANQNGANNNIMSLNIL